MMKPRREIRFSNTDVIHVIQRAVDKGVMFYSTIDRIVLYTTMAVHSKIEHVVVVACSFMFTHLHTSLIPVTEYRLEKYQHGYSTSYALSYNKHYDRDGDLFDKPFAKSIKRTAKEKRTNIAYVNNNHVEKGLVSSCRYSRWDFVPYAFSKYPFSKPIDKSSSPELRRFSKLVDRRSKAMIPLSYSDCERMFSVLSPEESEQLVDHIISTYALVDFDAAASYFKSLDKMVEAIDNMTGSEYDVNEEYVHSPDTGYEILLASIRPEVLGKIYGLSYDARLKLARRFASLQEVRDVHLSKFFRIDTKDLLRR